MKLLQKIIFSVFCLYLASGDQSSDLPCDRSKCPGPLEYYRILKCIPKYKNPRDCCAYMYDCNNLSSRSLEKCYDIQGQEYEIGESLKNGHGGPCDIGCTCRLNSRTGAAEFVCPPVDCLARRPRPGCYFEHISAHDCCGGREICPTQSEHIPKCRANGKIYKDGEPFIPDSAPNKICLCSSNYTGEIVEPFCIDRPLACRFAIGSSHNIVKKCAPTYFYDQPPQTFCSIFSRCQNERDTVIKASENTAEKSDVVCHFGNLTMHYGDELNQNTGPSSICRRCVCEVGPVPTCQRLSQRDCDAIEVYSSISTRRH